MSWFLDQNCLFVKVVICAENGLYFNESYWFLVRMVCFRRSWCLVRMVCMWMKVVISAEGGPFLNESRGFWWEWSVLEWKSWCLLRMVHFWRKVMVSAKNGLFVEVVVFAENGLFIKGVVLLKIACCWWSCCLWSIISFWRSGCLVGNGPFLKAAMWLRMACFWRSWRVLFGAGHNRVAKVRDQGSPIQVFEQKFQNN